MAAKFVLYSVQIFHTSQFTELSTQQDTCLEVCIPIHDTETRFQAYADNMKFTHDLKFNKAPDWKDSYVDYWHLKKLIYKNEKSAAENRSNSADPERLSLLSSFRYSDFLYVSLGLGSSVNYLNRTYTELQPRGIGRKS